MQENTASDSQDVSLAGSDISPTAASGPAGSQMDATTHLANERTFLAWSFTSMAMIGGGVALARMLIALNTSWVMSKAIGIIPAIFQPTTMGLVFLGAGLVVMMAATCRYLIVQKQISEQRYQPSDTLALMLMIIVTALGVLLALFLFQLTGSSS